MFLVVFAGCLALGSRMLNTDSDLGRHLALGSYMLDSRTVPARDVLSFSKAGQPRPPYEWLAQVVFALSDRFLGLDGIVLLVSVVIAGAFAIVFLDAYDRTRRPVLSLVVCGWAAVASSLHWLTRPHVFTFLFLAVWLAALERLRAGRRIPLWLFPALMVVWTNTHGGFVFGVVVWAAYMAGWLVEFVRRTALPRVGSRVLLAGIASTAATVITPDSWHNWQAVFQNRSAYVLSRTIETSTPNLSQPATWPFVALLGVCAIGLVLIRSRAAPAHVFVLGGLAAAALVMARNIPLFAIAAAPIAATWLAEAERRLPRVQSFEAAILGLDRNLKGYLWPTVAAVSVLAWLGMRALDSKPPIYGFNPQVFPVEAASWEQAHPRTGLMFNDINWGGYLLYTLWPSQKVFIDSQSDFYGEAFIREYEDIVSARPGWQAALDHYAIGWVIIPTNSRLAEQLAASGGWRTIHSDNTASIFAKAGTP